MGVNTAKGQPDISSPCAEAELDDSCFPRGGSGRGEGRKGRGRGTGKNRRISLYAQIEELLFSLFTKGNAPAASLYYVCISRGSVKNDTLCHLVFPLCFPFAPCKMAVL